MSVSTILRPMPAVTPAASRGSLLDHPAVIVLLGVAFSFALSWPRLAEIWRDNTFFDTDDAMRLVQVRDWLGGQEWFDLVEHRLSPPAGLLMHWSRIVDVPVGGLIRFFGLFASSDSAERLARIVFPLLLQVGLVATAVGVARMLLGPGAMVPGMILIVLSGFCFEQFPPGRIDHHAPQITLLLAMTGAMLSALRPGHEWHAAVAGVAIAVSLGISLENLPFIAVVVAVLPLAWLSEPRGTRTALAWFAGSLVVAALVVFVATIPPARYGDPARDAYSIAHLTALVSGAMGLLALVMLSDRLKGPVARGVSLGLVGCLVAGLMVALFPACLRDPYAGMDPVLKSLWLGHVTEAQPLLAASLARPDTFTMLFCPLLCGAIGAAVAVWRERGLGRVQWSAILALILIGLAGTIWQIRVASSTQPLAVLGGVWAVTQAVAVARRRASALGMTAACLLVVPFATLGWALVPTPGGDAAAATALAQGQACRATAMLAPLATLPRGLIFAPIDDGAHLLVATPHSVVAAPYHRNQTGNRLALDGFMATPEAAERIVRATGARYVAICPGEVEISALAQVAPAGLGAQLVRGESPAWLVPLVLPGTAYRVFALRDPAR